MTPTIAAPTASFTHAAWRTKTWRTPRFSPPCWVHGSRESDTVTVRVLFPVPVRATSNTRVTVSPAAIVPFVRSLPSLLYQMGSSDNVTVEPALVAVSLALTFDAVPRPGLFVTLSLAETPRGAPASVAAGCLAGVFPFNNRSALPGRLPPPGVRMHNASAG